MNAGLQQMGRLSKNKSRAYLDAIGQVEARANKYSFKYMLISDLAFALSAAELGMSPNNIASSLIDALLNAQANPPSADVLGQSHDIVDARERWLAELIGAGAAAWVHLGRNRGESLRSYIPRLFFIDHFHEQANAIDALVAALIEQSEKHHTTLCPAYHHLQHAGISTLAEYLLSWATAFVRHRSRIPECVARLNLSPPPTTRRPDVKALYHRVSRRLGFSREATIRREGMWFEDHFSEPLFLFVLLQTDLARLCEDLRLWMTAEFSFFQPGDQHAAGSSALPQKKNPFGLQSTIGLASIGVGRLAAQLSGNISPSDQSDMLFHSGSLYEFSIDVINSIRFVSELISEGSFFPAEMAEKTKLGWSGTTIAQEILVYDFGVPFRHAHEILGSAVRAMSQDRSPPDIRELCQSATGQSLAIDNQRLLDLIKGDTPSDEAVDQKAIASKLLELKSMLAETSQERPAVSPVETVRRRLEADARAWLENNRS